MKILYKLVINELHLLAIALGCYECMVNVIFLAKFF